MKDTELFEYIASETAAGRSAVLIIIADTKGSSAGKAGFKCVAGHDKILGTVGGGTAEHLLIKEAKQMLKLSKAFINLKELVHNPKADGPQSGMICSGRQTAILYNFRPEDSETGKKIADASALRERPGLLKLSAEKVIFEENGTQSKRIEFSKPDGKQFLYSEQIGYPDTLYIVGGGHVGAAVSDIFSNLDFYIKVFDHRKDLNIFKNITTAHEKLVIEYKQFHLQVKPDEKKYILIMTSDHASDQSVLKQALRTNAVYVGMLGSKAKIHSIFSNLKKEGFSREELEKVYTPAGLPIASNTTYEIAVSIAGEIIDIRNKRES